MKGARRLAVIAVVAAVVVIGALTYIGGQIEPTLGGPVGEEIVRWEESRYEGSD